MRGVLNQMSKRQKAKVKNAMIYGSLFTSMAIAGWLAILIPDGDPFAIVSATICIAYMTLFIIANKAWEWMP